MARNRNGVRFRRSPHLVAFWHGDTLVLRNYATGQSAAATTLVCRVLDFCTDWCSLREIQTHLESDRSPLLPQLLELLAQRTMLQRSDAPADPRERAMSLLKSWNPEAGFFHTATKHVRFWSTREARRQARLQATLSPMPKAVRRYPGAPLIDLPGPTDTEDAFMRAVRGRRTWRRFSSAPVTKEQLSTVLGLGTGVQQWVSAGGPKIPLKTSPSGGARHPIECYVVIRHVQGLRAGVYHYAADRHALERLRGPVSKDRLRQYLPHSGYFAEASALFFLTAVFARQLWRYPYSRAYRAALIEAGHVCQTMLLTATWLGLAPFSLMGLADPLIEKDLRLDGITESVLYAAGVGRPPARTSWAPLSRGTLQVRRNPRLS